MIIISHRGNLLGPKTALFGENNPRSIENALDQGFHCEIDLHIVDNDFYLGHDEPDYKVDESFLFRNGMWIHAKNFAAFNWVLSTDGINGFYHDRDDYALTSVGFIWTYPNPKLELNYRSVAVLPEHADGWKNLEKCYGICTDYKDFLKKGKA